jgi:cell division protein FtsB
MAICGARPASRFGPLGRSRPRSRTVAQPRRRTGAGRRAQRVSGVPGVLIGIAAAAGLALFHLSQSSHVAATGYQIADLRAALAELRAEQQQLILQIGEARSPAVIERHAKGALHLVTLRPNAVTFAQPSPKKDK